MFESSTVNEPSGFEPLRLYCILYMKLSGKWLENRMMFKFHMHLVRAG